MKLFLDTDVVINILKKQPKTVEKFQNLIADGATFCISPIVIAEIYHGARADEYATIERLFSFFEVQDINAKIGYYAGLYANAYAKAYNKISLEDYLIAASVKYYGLQLRTYNKKHYPMKDIVLI